MEEKDWKRVLKADPTEWLLGEDNPPVRYYTMVDLLDMEPSDPEVQKTKSQIAKCELVREIFRQQKERTYWERKDNFHKPHYTASVWQLTLLSDLGFTVEDERILNGVEHVLSFQNDDGSFPGHNPQRCDVGAFDIGFIARFMAKFGMSRDPRLGKIYGWMTKSQFPDGGWGGIQRVRKGRKESCFASTVNVLWGMAQCKDFVGSSTVKRAADFLSKVRPRKDFSYPQFWQFWADDLKIADILSCLGFTLMDEALRTRVDTVLELQGKDGYWREIRGTYPTKPENCAALRKLFPQKGMPSKWITLNAMRLIKRLYEQDYEEDFIHYLKYVVDWTADVFPWIENKRRLMEEAMEKKNLVDAESILAEISGKVEAMESILLIVEFHERAYPRWADKVGGRFAEQVGGVMDKAKRMITEEEASRIRLQEEKLAELKSLGGVEVRIRIEANSAKDSYERAHGMTFDKSLRKGFWDNQEDAVIDTRATPFTHEKTVVLLPGPHYMIYGNSAGGADFRWDAKVYINDMLEGQGKVSRGQFLKVTFTIPKQKQEP